MTTRRISTLAVVLVLAANCCSRTSSQQGPASGSAGFAVVELFTSQGCNSCPSADLVLRQLATVAEKEDLPIYCLSFHVDYWDHLGWKDPFSDANYTRRQRQYARAMQKSRVYTPQMIVNGTAQFVGSRKTEAQSQVSRALVAEKVGQLRIQSVTSEGQRLFVDFQLSDIDAADAILNMAVVERELSTSIERGENAGRKLQYANVVRAFKATLLEDKVDGRVELVPANGSVLRNCSIVAYVQNGRNLEMLAAHAVPIRSLEQRDQ